jgi:hypothetical protein
MIVANELDSNGRLMCLKVRVLKSTESDGLVLVEGRVMKILLGTALKLIRLGICERKNPRRSSSKRRRAIAEKKARLAIHESQALAANPAIVIESMV